MATQGITQKLVSYPKRYKSAGTGSVVTKRVAANVVNTQDGVTIAGPQANPEDKDAGNFQVKVRSAKVSERVKSAWRQATGTMALVAVGPTGGGMAGVFIGQLIENFKPGTKVAYEVAKEGAKPKREAQEWLISGKSVAQQSPKMTANPERHKRSSSFTFGGGAFGLAAIDLGHTEPLSISQPKSSKDSDAGNYTVEVRKPTVGERLSASVRYAANKSLFPAYGPGAGMVQLALGVKQGFSGDNLIAEEKPINDKVNVGRQPQKWMIRMGEK